MLLLIAAFQLLIIILNRVIKDNSKTLNYIAVILGFLFFSLFLLFNREEIPSTSAHVMAANLTDDELNIYYLTIHDAKRISKNCIRVHYDKKLKPKTSSEYFFEAETAEKYWVIATNAEGQIKFSDTSLSSRSEGFYNDTFKIEKVNKLNSDNLQLAKQIINQDINEHRLFIGLMILILILNIILIGDIRRR